MLAKKTKIQYERKSRIIPGKEPHATRPSSSQTANCGRIDEWGAHAAPDLVYALISCVDFAFVVSSSSGSSKRDATVFHAFQRPW
ncbi:unnamed protein product [Clavelina lepadiformis]|uniref:Uncharacterized protein n=1 Tax=Clavelina lepadiformis TaxID=159417 RepID=A0ABP0GYZ3_CLALP